MACPPYTNIRDYIREVCLEANYTNLDKMYALEDVIKFCDWELTRLEREDSEKKREY